MQEYQNKVLTYGWDLLNRNDIMELTKTEAVCAPQNLLRAVSRDESDTLQKVHTR